MAIQAMIQLLKGQKAQCQESSSNQDLKIGHRAKLRQRSDDNAQELRKLI